MRWLGSHLSRALCWCGSKILDLVYVGSIPTPRAMNDDLNDLVPQTWVVDEETWQWLNELLERPARECPSLSRLMSRPSMWVDIETTANTADDSSQ